MAMQDLRQWTEQERERVTVLSNAVQEKVGVVPEARREEWIADLRDRFDHLRAHLIKHMALEEEGEGGYLAFVLKQRPTLSDLVGRLKHTHGELIRLMDVIHRQLADLRPDDRLLIRDACARLNDLINYVEHHGDHEALVMTYAFSQDPGAND